MYFSYWKISDLQACRSDIFCRLSVEIYIACSRTHVCVENRYDKNGLQNMHEHDCGSLCGRIHHVSYQIDMLHDVILYFLQSLQTGHSVSCLYYYRLMSLTPDYEWKWRDIHISQTDMDRPLDGDVWSFLFLVQTNDLQCPWWRSYSCSSRHFALLCHWFNIFGVRHIQVRTPIVIGQNEIWRVW